jgi:membrane protein YqaA with SNARE-associated domain
LLTSSFLAATILPGGSEAVLFGVLKLHPDLFWKALAVATIGNTLGGMSSYGLGRLFAKSAPTRGRALIERWGPASLLLSWVPIVGDALCVGAGWLRLNPALCTLFVAVGKLARYWVIAALAT